MKLGVRKYTVVDFTIIRRFVYLFSIHAPVLTMLLFFKFHMTQEEAELGVVMDSMTAGHELLRQKEERLKVMENALLGGLVRNVTDC